MTCMDEGEMKHDIYLCLCMLSDYQLSRRKNDKCDDRSAKEFFANALLSVPLA